MHLSTLAPKMKISSDDREKFAHCPTLVAIAMGVGRVLERYKLKVDLSVNKWDGMPPFPALTVYRCGFCRGEVNFYPQAVTVSTQTNASAMQTNRGMFEYEDPQLDLKIIQLAIQHMGARRTRRKRC